MIRAAVIIGLILTSMVAIKDGRALKHVGVLSSCSGMEAPPGDDGFWTACRAGTLEGRPNLTRNACDPRGVVGDVEYWRCAAPLGSGRRP